MNFMTFTYTKADGKISTRAFLPLVVPNTMYEGIDISELDDDQQGDFVAQMEAIRSKYLAEMAVVQAAFDVKNMYRRFDSTKMTNVVKETL